MKLPKSFPRVLVHPASVPLRKRVIPAAVPIDAEPPAPRTHPPVVRRDLAPAADAPTEIVCEVPRWWRAACRTLAVLTVVVLMPTLLLIALAVRLSGPGPVLVRQGGWGAPRASVGVLRFRTTTGTGRQAVRPTRVGRTLRVLGLDALPKLLDVACGGPSVLYGGR